MGETAVGVRGIARRRPVATFAVLVLVLSWPMLLLSVAFPAFAPVTALLSPAACAFAVTALADGRAGVRELGGRLLRWRVPARWYLFVLFGMGGAILAAAYAVTAVFYPGNLALPPESVLVPLGVNFLILIVAVGIQEEIGWRGFALPRLLERTSPLAAAGIVGLLWWAWHLPLMVVRTGDQDTVAYLALFFVLVMADSVIYTWVFRRKGGSVLLVGLMHAAGNVWGGNLYRLTFSFDPPGYLLFDTVRIGIYVLVALAIVVLTRGRLGAAGRQGA